MATALITGVLGQDAFYLANLLVGKGYNVFGLVHGSFRSKAARLKAELPGVIPIAGDLGDSASLSRVVKRAQPDEIYNLAGPSFKPYSIMHPAEAVDVLGTGVLRLLEAIRTSGRSKEIRLLQVSSSEMFGTPAESPQTEQTPPRPENPYAVAKAFAHQLVGTYRAHYGIHASCSICYNHESPRRRAEFVTRRISLGVARIALGRQDKLVLGDLESRRDWGFAGDYVEAMYRILQQPFADDYVVASGTLHKVRDFCDVAFGHVGIHDWDRYVEVDGNLIRTKDIQNLLGDTTKIRSELGWQPKVTFEDLVRLMVDHDIERVGKSSERNP